MVATANEFPRNLDILNKDGLFTNQKWLTVVQSLKGESNIKFTDMVQVRRQQKSSERWEDKSYHAILILYGIKLPGNEYQFAIRIIDIMGNLIFEESLYKNMKSIRSGGNFFQFIGKENAYCLRFRSQRLEQDFSTKFRKILKRPVSYQIPSLQITGFSKLSDDFLQEAWKNTNMPGNLQQESDDKQNSLNSSSLKKLYSSNAEDTETHSARSDAVGGNNKERFNHNFNITKPAKGIMKNSKIPNAPAEEPKKMIKQQQQKNNNNNNNNNTGKKPHQGAKISSKISSLSVSELNTSSSLSSSKAVPNSMPASLLSEIKNAPKSSNNNNNNTSAAAAKINQKKPLVSAPNFKPPILKQQQQQQQVNAIVSSKGHNHVAPKNNNNNIKQDVGKFAKPAPKTVDLSTYTHKQKDDNSKNEEKAVEKITKKIEDDIKTNDSGISNKSKQKQSNKTNNKAQKVKEEKEDKNERKNNADYNERSKELSKSTEILNESSDKNNDSDKKADSANNYQTNNDNNKNDDNNDISKKTEKKKPSMHDLLNAQIREGKTLKTVENVEPPKKKGNDFYNRLKDAIEERNIAGGLNNAESDSEPDSDW